jgi:hypothetical protein
VITPCARTECVSDAFKSSTRPCFSAMYRGIRTLTRAF